MKYGLSKKTFITKLVFIAVSMLQFSCGSIGDFIPHDENLIICPIGPIDNCTLSAMAPPSYTLLIEQTGKTNSDRSLEVLIGDVVIEQDKLTVLENHILLDGDDVKIYEAYQFSYAPSTNTSSAKMVVFAGKDREVVLEKSFDVKNTTTNCGISFVAEIPAFQIIELEDELPSTEKTLEGNTIFTDGSYEIDLLAMSAKIEMAGRNGIVYHDDLKIHDLNSKSATITETIGNMTSASPNFQLTVTDEAGVQVGEMIESQINCREYNYYHHNANDCWAPILTENNIRPIASFIELKKDLSSTKLRYITAIISE